MDHFHVIMDSGATKGASASRDARLTSDIRWKRRGDHRSGGEGACSVQDDLIEIRLL